jgi:hypothetical protein
MIQRILITMALALCMLFGIPAVYGQQSPEKVQKTVTKAMAASEPILHTLLFGSSVDVSSFVKSPEVRWIFAIAIAFALAALLAPPLRPAGEDRRPQGDQR